MRLYDLLFKRLLQLFKRPVKKREILLSEAIEITLNRFSKTFRDLAEYDRLEKHK